MGHGPFSKINFPRSLVNTPSDVVLRFPIHFLFPRSNSQSLKFRKKCSGFWNNFFGVPAIHLECPDLVGFFPGYPDVSVLLNEYARNSSAECVHTASPNLRAMKRVISNFSECAEIEREAVDEIVSLFDRLRSPFEKWLMIIILNDACALSKKEYDDTILTPSANETMAASPEPLSLVPEKMRFPTTNILDICRRMVDDDLLFEWETSSTFRPHHPQLCSAFTNSFTVTDKYATFISQHSQVGVTATGMRRCCKMTY